MDIKKVLLSGICKYYRRGMYDKFLWCVIEMLLFKYHKKRIVFSDKCIK